MGEIRLENVSKSFGNFKAVDNVSLTINNGELFSFLGPSGCGKTTILRMIAGFEMPTKGRIYIENQDITELPPYKRQVNTIFQNYSFSTHEHIRERCFWAKNQKCLKRNKKQVHECLILSRCMIIKINIPMQ